MTSIHIPDSFLWESVDTLEFLSEQFKIKLHENSIHEIGAFLSCSEDDLKRLTGADTQDIENIKASLQKFGSYLGEPAGWIPGVSYEEILKGASNSINHYIWMRDKFLKE